MTNHIKVLEYVGLPGAGKTTIVKTTHTGCYKVDVFFVAKTNSAILRVILKIVLFLKAFIFLSKPSLRVLLTGIHERVRLIYIFNAILLQYTLRSARKDIVLDQSLVQLILCNRVINLGSPSPQFEKELKHTISLFEYTVRTLHIDLDTFVIRSSSRNSQTKTQIKACSENYHLFNEQLSVIIDEMSEIVRFENF